MTKFNANPITTAEQVELCAAYGTEFVQPDWAESLTDINAGLRVLQDAFPASDKEAVQAGYKQVQDALHHMRRFLLIRNVEVL
jgi:hypothetical protein